MVRGVKMGLGEFLGSSHAPDADLPSGPRPRQEGESGFSGRGGRGDRGDRGDRSERRGYDREPSRSDQSDSWRGDRFNSGGGFRGREETEERSWRRGGDRSQSDRYNRRDFSEREPMERPASMRLNLQARSIDSTSQAERPPRSNDGNSGDKFANAFTKSTNRFNRLDPSPEASSDIRKDMERVSLNTSPAQAQSIQPKAELQVKKSKGQLAKEERRRKAEEERLAVEALKEKLAKEKEEKKQKEAKKAETDRVLMEKILSTGKMGSELAQEGKKVIKEAGERIYGGTFMECVLEKAEETAKSSANWIAENVYGELLRVGFENAEKQDGLGALNALQLFLNKYDFPKGVLEKSFMALYSLDILDETAFIDYKYDVDSEVPGRMKAIVQTSTWLTWLETPEEESEEDEE